MARFEVTEAEEEGAPERTLSCAAHGCPLIGSMTFSTTGSDMWFCRYHYSVDSRDWAGITTRIKRAMQSLRDYDIRKRTNPFSDDNAETMRKAFKWIREGVKPREPEEPGVLKGLLAEAQNRMKIK